jgi:glycosyltransferase involved in cell wall biosynthesis
VPEHPFAAGRPLAETLQGGRRVAMITLGFWPQQAGMEMVFHNLARGMTRAGDLVVLFTPMPAEPFEEIPRNYIIRRYKNEQHFHRMFGEHHAAMPFDCILVQGAFEAATLARAAGQAHGVPVVLRTHGEDIQQDPTIGYGYRLDPRKAPVIEDNIRQVAHNIAISTPVGKEVAAIGPHGPVTVIGNGVDTEHFRPRPSRAIREAFPGIAEETCVLLMVGRNVRKKSLGHAVEALALLRAQGHDVCLVHAGKPGSGENLREKAVALGVADRFHELGARSYFDMPEVYASADIFVFPSKMETFGNVTLEAMASGLPCVEFDYGANHDKISEGETGFIVPWGDVPALAAAIGRLVSDAGERRRMGAAARRAAEEKFGWPAVVARYRDVIARTARPRMEAP